MSKTSPDNVIPTNIGILSSLTKESVDLWYPNISPYIHTKKKRFFEIFMCLLLLIPALLCLLVILTLVLVIDGWPVLFFQRRLGKNAVPFYLPKIRTLLIDAPSNRPAHSYDTNAVMTITGKFLRKHRFDELPQIFLVLTGRMSLIGPRPELLTIAANYTKKEKRRLCIKPGLTGLWQVEAARNQPIQKNIKYDLYYLRKASLLLDIKILVKTAVFVVRGGKKIMNKLENSL